MSMCALGEVTARANVALLCNSICLRDEASDTGHQAEVITNRARAR